MLLSSNCTRIMENLRTIKDYGLEIRNKPDLEQLLTHLAGISGYTLGLIERLEAKLQQLNTPLPGG